MGGGSKTTTTTTVTRTPEEIEYTKQQIKLAQQQMQLIEEQHGIQTEIYAITKPLLEKWSMLIDQDLADQNSPEAQALKTKQNQLTQMQLDSQIHNQPLQDEILQRQIEEIRRGGAATDAQKALIKDVADRSLAAGQTDIDRFMSKGVDQIRSQMAPARGMRPDDAPMIDAAQRVLEEATRQQGQLTQQVRGAQSQAELNFPLNAAQMTNQAGQWQQGFNAQMNEFLSGLGNQAHANRAQLMGQLFSAPMSSVESGLNLANASRPNPVNFTQNTTTTQKQSGGSVFGGIGGLLSGIGSVGSLFSSKKAKTNIKPLEAPPGHLLSPGAVKRNIQPLGEAGGLQGGPSVTNMLSDKTMANDTTPQYTSPAQPVKKFVDDVTPQYAGGLGLAGPQTQPPAPRSDDDILDRIAKTPVSSWQYKPETGLGQDTHFGPMAEDFNTTVMGKAPQPFINTVDMVGSLMASVKALDRRTRGLGMASPKKKLAFAGGR
jgi:hypothetical protein